MRRTRLSRALTIGVLLAAILMTVQACGDAQSPAAPTPVVTPAAPAAPADNGVTAALVGMLTETIQDEYHAAAVYGRVLGDFGTVNPFANIIRAEENHAAAIGRLFDARGLAVPGSVWNVTNVPVFSSVPAACAAAAEAEIDNIKLYDKYLQEALPTDVRTVFENNRRASLENHLPAFERCR